MSDPMKLSMLMVVSCCVGTWALNPDPLQQQLVLLATSLQSATDIL